MKNATATRKQTAKAIELRMTWKAAGAPGVVTAHEAFRLSNGLTGVEGDHSTPVSLASVALLVAKKA